MNDRWFNATSGGADPMATAPSWDASRPLTMNDWRGAAYTYDEEWHPTAWVGREAARVVDGHDDARPLFLKVSFHRPHSPYDPPQRLLAPHLANSELLTPPLVAEDGWDAAKRGVCEGSKVNYTRTDPRDVAAGMWCGDIGVTESQKTKAAYFASVEFVDEALGVVLEALERRGWLEETLVLYTADHGDALGDHYLWRKTYPYESSARIPLILRAGVMLEKLHGLSPMSAGFGRIENDRVTEIRDVMPTLLDAAGLQPNPDPTQPLDGRSLFDLLRGGDDSSNATWRAWIDLEHSRCYNSSNHWNALTDGSTKYIYHAASGVEQLFDLRSDPGELSDLGGHPEAESRLSLWRSRLVAQFRSEGRGTHFLSENGELVIRTTSTTYSPFYPASIAP